MLIFTPAYVILAFASWSALAVPLSGSERSVGDGSLSSTLMSRDSHQQDTGPGLETIYITPDNSVDPGSASGLTMDCGGDEDKHKHKHKDDSTSTSQDNGNPNYGSALADPANQGTSSTPTMTSNGIPTIARRRFRSPMRRGTKDAKTSIFSREEGSHTTTAREPTVGEIVARYLQQRSASRKRAMRPRTSRGAY